GSGVGVRHGRTRGAVRVCRTQWHGRRRRRRDLHHPAGLDARASRWQVTGRVFRRQPACRGTSPGPAPPAHVPGPGRLLRGGDRAGKATIGERSHVNQAIDASVVTSVRAWEALDSRGRPTVACAVELADGRCGRVVVPSGASTGTYEAVELRDGGPRYGGYGVRKAVANVNAVLGPAVIGRDAADQRDVDT